MAQLYPSKRVCNRCGGIISWDIATRERLQTKLPLNLDGTVHDQKSCELVKAEHPGLPTSPSYSTERSTSTQTYNSASKTEAIQKAHEENMDSSERLRRSLDNLAEKIDKFSLIVSDTISAYLALEKKAE